MGAETRATLAVKEPGGEDGRCRGSTCRDLSPRLSRLTSCTRSLACALCAASQVDLGQMLLTLQPSLLMMVDDAGSVATRAAVSILQMDRSGGGAAAAAAAAAAAEGAAGEPSPPLALMRWPASAPEWAADAVGSLAAPELRQWGATRLAVIALVSASPARLPAFHASFVAAALVSPGGGETTTTGRRQRARGSNSRRELGTDLTSLMLLMPYDAPPSVVAYAQSGWAWPVHAKHIRFRVDVVGGRCASAGLRDVLRHLEAWSPFVAPPPSAPAGALGGVEDATSSSRPHGTDGSGGDGDGGYGGGSDEWALIVRDDVELSPGFYVYVRHFLARADSDAAHVSQRGLLGFALGVPMEGGGGGGAVRGRLPIPSSCGAAYSAAAWLELQQYAMAKLGLVDGGQRCSDADAAAPHAANGPIEALGNWSGVQRRFMAERGYALHYSGLTLCRRQGDASVRLSSGEEVAAHLAAKH